MIAARQIAFGKAAGKKKPYKARLEYLKTVEFNTLGPKIKLPFLDWTHFEAEISISDAGDRKYIGAIYGEEGATGMYGGCYGVLTISGFYRGSAVYMGFADSTYVPSLDTKVYYKSPSPTNLQWTIGSENISVPLCKRKYSSFHLFFANSNAAGYGYAPSTLWWVKIYDGEELKRSVIPVLDNANVPCMYDEVSGEFFYNQGDGEFIAGPVVDEVDYTAKDYIQDGLVAMWDGIENAGWGTHDQNATVWKDLVNGISVSPYSSSATPLQFGDNCAMFDGTSYLNAKMPQVLVDVFSANVTVEFIGDTSLSSAQHIFSISEGARNEVWFQSNQQFFSWGSSSDTQYCQSTGLTCPRHGAVQIGNGSISSFVNGTPAKTEAISVSSTPNTSSNLRIGGSRYLTGKVFGVRIYNRALTAEEVAHNYSIDRARFNLP